MHERHQLTKPTHTESTKHLLLQGSLYFRPKCRKMFGSGLKVFINIVVNYNMFQLNPWDQINPWDQ